MQGDRKRFRARSVRLPAMPGPRTGSLPAGILLSGSDLQHVFRAWVDYQRSLPDVPR